MDSFLPLVLASTSPQRSLLLQQMHLDFLVHALDCHEDQNQSVDALELVEMICRDKMRAAFAQIPAHTRGTRGILCSDTMVAKDHHRMGKPADRKEAARFLDILSGSVHQVVTGMAWLPAGSRNPEDMRYLASVSDVHFLPLSPGVREWYLDSGEWKEAAGGYRIQGRGAALIRRIEGSWTGIMGLAVELLAPLMDPSFNPGT